MTEPLIEDRNSLVSRVKNILLTPKSEWARMDGERATTASIYVPYVLLLAAIGPVAALIAASRST